MSSPSKAKGSRLERAIVKAFTDAGHDCKRAWGSNGRSIGMPDDVDNVATVNGVQLRIQAKARKKVADFMKPPASCNAAIIKEDRGDMLVVMRIQDFIDLLHESRSTQEQSHSSTPIDAQQFP